MISKTPKAKSKNIMGLIEKTPKAIS